MPCRITVRLSNGQTLSAEKKDYEGFHARPMSWETALGKFDAPRRARARTPRCGRKFATLSGAWRISGSRTCVGCSLSREVTVMREGSQGNAERAFPFLPLNKRQGKPRARGITDTASHATRPWESGTWRMCLKPWAHTLMR